MESKKGNKSSPLKYHSFLLADTGWGMVGGGGEEEQVTTQQIWFSDCWIAHARARTHTHTHTRKGKRGKKQQAQIEKTQPSFQLDLHA